MLKESVIRVEAALQSAVVGLTLKAEEDCVDNQIKFYRQVNIALGHTLVDIQWFGLEPRLAQEVDLFVLHHQNVAPNLQKNTVLPHKGKDGSAVNQFICLPQVKEYLEDHLSFACHLFHWKLHLPHHGEAPTRHC